jgi:ribosome-associated translation inhibitor RaiA
LGFPSALAITVSTTMVAHIGTKLLKLHKYLLKLTLLNCHIRLKKKSPDLQWFVDKGYAGKEVTAERNLDTPV